MSSNKVAVLVLSIIFGLGTLAATLVLVFHESDGQVPAGLGIPTVTRDDVLAHWAKMPAALAAKPTDIDREADRLCARVRQDDSAATLIANAESLDRSYRAGDGLFREHLRLMIAYKCPQYVKYFE